MTHVPDSLSRRTVSEVAERTRSERTRPEPATSLADAFGERATAPSVQDAFLNNARRDRVGVTVHLMTGRSFDARIKGFDRYAVVVDVNGAEQLVFKHAIAFIETARAAANAFGAPHS